MRDILPILQRWTGEGQAVALGSVIERIGSAPRDPGAALAVSAAGEVAGSVTGGCVEPAVIREATEVLNGARGPDADELVIEWPDRFLDDAPIDARTAICMMTHDLKFDVPALKRALASGAGYIGAIGSEKTRNERDARLRDEGVGDADLARL